MEKDYGIEYEREVLAAFDRMAKKYENHEAEASAPAAKSIDDRTTRVFTKEQEQRMNEMMAELPEEEDSAASVFAAAAGAVSGEEAQAVKGIEEGKASSEAAAEKTEEKYAERAASLAADGFAAADLAATTIMAPDMQNPKNVLIYITSDLEIS